MQEPMFYYFVSSLKSFICRNYLDFLGMVLPLRFEKGKKSIGHQQFQGNPILK